MKRFILCIGLSILTAAATAQSTVSISGVLKVAGAHSNGGDSPFDSPFVSKWSINDQYSAIIFSGKEDLGDRMYAGFELASFLRVDDGTTWASSGGPFFSRRAVVKLGGAFGEFYAGRSLTPQALMTLLYDPWYWDGSAAQMGWGVVQANYTSTSFIRTNNTIGYVSPKFSGFAMSLAASAGEGAVSRDIGGSLSYESGPLSLGVAYDQSHGFFNDATQNHITTVAGAYDFGAVRPALIYSASSVNGASYKSYALAATAPVGPGLVKAQFARLDDGNTTVPGKQALQRLGLGYQYNLSKRSNVFAQVARSKMGGLSATRVVELGVEHSF